jgi:acetyl esterase
MSFIDKAESAVLEQTRKAVRAVLALPAARAEGLGRTEDFAIPGPGGPMRARYYQAADPEPGPIILFFHGGGFMVGDIDTHDGLCSWLVKAYRGRLISVDYRLAPETHFPGQIEDARAACAWTLDNAGRLGATARQLIPCGDSAGGYLAAAMALELNRAALGTVPLQVLLYPLVHVEDAIWREEALKNFRFVGRAAAYYIARGLAEPLPSLLDADLSLAPTTIVAGGGPMDPVSADTDALVAALRHAGVHVVERKYAMLTHGGFNLTAVSKTAIQALTEVGELMRARAGGARGESS